LLQLLLLLLLLLLQLLPQLLLQLLLLLLGPGRRRQGRCGVLREGSADLCVDGRGSLCTRSNLKRLVARLLAGQRK
jgi:hypothetical protein